MKKDKKYMSIQKELSEIMASLLNKPKKQVLNTDISFKSLSSICKRTPESFKDACNCSMCKEEDEHAEEISELEDTILELKEKIVFLENQNKELQINKAQINQSEILGLYNLISQLDLSKINNRIKRIQSNILEIVQNNNKKEEIEKIINLERNTQLKIIEELRETILLQKNKEKELKSQILDLKGSIRVFCRIRPSFERETCQIINTEEKIELIDCNLNKKYNFQFDQIFSANDTQKDIFNEIKPIIANGLEGYKICIFAYGQTGSGKTFTMEGNSLEKGIIYSSIDLIFDLLNEFKKDFWDFEISVNVVEIYNENIFDLLQSEEKNEGKAEIKYQDNKLVLLNCLQPKIKSKPELIDYLKLATKNRSVGSTASNLKSSRSHCVFILNIQLNNSKLKELRTTSYTFIDLAGSERINQSKVEGIRLKETQNINKSLSNLGNVIIALIKKETHVPFRDSKLTYLLKDFLTNNARILMFANVSPELNHLNESVCTLRFAAKVSECKLGSATKVCVNEV